MNYQKSEIQSTCYFTHILLEKLLRTPLNLRLFTM